MEYKTEEIVRFAEFLKVTPGEVMRAVADCGMECTPFPNARKKLLKKFSEMLDCLEAQ